MSKINSYVLKVSISQKTVHIIIIINIFLQFLMLEFFSQYDNFWLNRFKMLIPQPKINKNRNVPRKSLIGPEGVEKTEYKNSPKTFPLNGSLCLYLRKVNWPLKWALVALRWVPSLLSEPLWHWEWWAYVSIRNPSNPFVVPMWVSRILEWACLALRWAFRGLFDESQWLTDMSRIAQGWASMTHHRRVSIV